MTRSSVAERAGALALSIAVLSACATAANSEPTRSAGATSWELNLDATLEDARLRGAGERQIEVLEKARAEGSLDYKTVLDLVHDTFGCFEDAGIGYTEHPADERAPGWTLVRYSFDAEAPGLTEQQVTDLADACMTTHSMFAEFVLQDPSQHQEARDARMRSELPTILACLERHGVLLDAEATLDEVRLAAIELLNDTADSPEPAVCWDDLSTTG